jgi:hypothetical protein
LSTGVGGETTKNVEYRNVFEEVLLRGEDFIGI